MIFISNIMNRKTCFAPHKAAVEQAPDGIGRSRVPDASHAVTHAPSSRPVSDDPYLAASQIIAFITPVSLLVSSPADIACSSENCFSSASACCLQEIRVHIGIITVSANKDQNGKQPSAESQLAFCF